MWFLALRHLTSKRRQTMLTLAGITLGTAAYVGISGMMLGFQTFIIDQLVNNDSHVRIQAREEYVNREAIEPMLFSSRETAVWVTAPSGRRDDQFIENPQGWFDILSHDTRVVAYSPQLTVQVVVTRGQTAISGRMIGSDPEKQVQISNVENYMEVGKFRDIGATGNRLIIGRALAERLGAQIGESLLITAGKGSPVPFKIVGIFNFGVRNLDEGTLFSALSDVQKLNQTPSRISDIAIRTMDASKASQLSQLWALLSSDKVQSWDEANEGIMSVFKTQDIVRYAMTVSILVVAGFGIYNILSMNVTTRRREIAVLRSMGYLPRDISRLFLTQGTILGLIGGVVGLLIGFGICQYLETIQVSKARGLGSGTMLISFSWKIYFQGFLMAFLSSVFSSFFPARAAGKLEPIDVIRSEGG